MIYEDKFHTLLKDIKEDQLERYTRFMDGKMHYNKDGNVEG